MVVPIYLIMGVFGIGYSDTLKMGGLIGLSVKVSCL